MKIDFNKAFDKLSKDFDQNQPVIFAGLALFGLALTSYKAYKAGYKGQVIMDRMKADMKDVKPGDKETKRVVIKETARDMVPVMAPVVVSGVLTATCIGWSSHVSMKKIAMLSTAYSITLRDYKDHLDATSKVLDEKNRKRIIEEVAGKKLERASNENREEVMSKGPRSDQDVLCYESLTGRYFYSTVNKLNHAMNALAAECRAGTYVACNEWFDMIGLDPVDSVLGDCMGWTSDKLINGNFEFELTTKLTDGGIPCIVVSYQFCSVEDVP